MLGLFDDMSLRDETANSRFYSLIDRWGCWPNYRSCLDCAEGCGMDRRYAVERRIAETVKLQKGTVLNLLSYYILCADVDDLS